MSLCDYSIYKYVTNKYFKQLNKLSPIKRAAEIFRLEIENLSLELKSTDEIFGWFIFDKNNTYENREFADNIPGEAVKKIIDAPCLHGSSTKLDKAHTLVDYEYILNNGLLAYQKRIDKELLISPDNEYLLAMKDVITSTKKLIDRILCFLGEKA